MGQDEGRRMERRIRPPPALPVRIVLPARRTELVGAHDLGADPGFMTGREGMVGADGPGGLRPEPGGEHPLVKRSEEHTSELQSLMRISYAVFCLKKKTIHTTTY